MSSPILHVFPDAEAVSRAAAAEFARRAVTAVAARGRFAVALSGGSTPQRMYQLLTEPPYRTQLDWTRVDVFWGDERCVPPDHHDSNYRMAREAMLSRLPIPPERIHRIEAERPELDAAARDYQQVIARVFGVPPDGEPPAFDLILLGMGPDGHTASLFPGTTALAEKTSWVVVNYVPKFAANRMTFTLPLLNRARAVLFLVAGADKAERIAEVLEGPEDPLRLPAQLVRPAGDLLWFVDRQAAAKLTRPPSETTREDERMNASAVKLAPSILAADFARLGDQVREAERAGADRIHVDVMDGHFVPNLSMGPAVVKSLRPVTRLPLEVHLMIEEPDRYAEPFVKAGGDRIIVHVELGDEARHAVARVRRLGAKVGVVLNPETPLEMVEEFLPDADLLLVMTVHPGFGGQAFLAETLDKVRRARELLDRKYPHMDLEVDGGIEPHTAPQAVAAGARVLVAGSAIFGAADGVAAAMGRLNAACGLAKG